MAYDRKSDQRIISNGNKLIAVKNTHQKEWNENVKNSINSQLDDQKQNTSASDFGSEMALLDRNKKKKLFFYFLCMGSNKQMY